MEGKKKATMTIVVATLGISILMPFATIPSANAASEPTLQPGDIIQVHCENAPWPWIGYWTHTMMYVSDDTIIESGGIGEEDGVHYEALSHELNQLDEEWGPITNIAYLKVDESKHPNPDIGEVLEFADGKVGREFDTFSLFVIPSKQADPPEGRPWSGYYCTELVWASYLEGTDINIELTPDCSVIFALEIYWSPELELRYVQHPDEVPPPEE